MMTFSSAEENEEAMRRLGVPQQIRQLGKGTFRAGMAVESTEHAEFYSNRFSTAFTMALEPPAGCVGVAFLRGSRGPVLVCGEEVAGDKLVVVPPGSSVDVVGPDLTASEAFTVPGAQFEHLTEVLCSSPRPAWPHGVAVIPGDVKKLHALRRGVLDLVVHPQGDPRRERPDSLVAEVIAWMGDFSREWRPERPVVNGARRRVAKRAQEFLEEHYWDSVHTEDLCRAAGVGLRTLQRCFRDYFHLTITDYLKTLRLNAARRELAAAEPGQVSVTTVAMRHGFAHFGRFSLEFRDRFGESPREALARGLGWTSQACLSTASPTARRPRAEPTMGIPTVTLSG
jgi:AraC-like DNA-binding protein